MEKGKYKIEIIEEGVHEVEHEAHLRELEMYRRGLEYGSKPLKTRVS